MSRALSVRNLRVWLRTPRGEVPVVRGLDLDLEAGERVGMAGESGSGKTISALALMGLLGTRGRMAAARLRLGATDLLSLPEPAWRRLRGSGLAMVFQDPASALDPVFRAGDQLAAVLRRAGAGRAGARTRALEALDAVGFAEPDRVYRAYPHELSGGMRQLVTIAMADALRPRVLLADEPTTALDVTTQQRILARLRELSDRHGTAVLLISHDLRVLSQCVSRALVLYAGGVVEEGPVRSLFSRPAHPYTAGLLAAAPRLDGALRAVQPIPGQAPAAGDALDACPFAPRCDRAGEECRERAPAPAAHGGTRAACHHPLVAP